MSFKIFLKVSIFVLLILVSLSSKSMALDDIPKGAVAIKLTHHLEAGDKAWVRVEYLNSQSQVIGFIGDYESIAHRLRDLLSINDRIIYYDDPGAYSVLGFQTKIQGSDITVEIIGSSFRARFVDYRASNPGPFPGLSCYDMDSPDCIVIDPQGRMFVPATIFCPILECQSLAIQTDSAHFKRDPVSIKLPQSLIAAPKVEAPIVKPMPVPATSPQKSDPPKNPAQSHGDVSSAMVNSAIYQIQYPNGCIAPSDLDGSVRRFFGDQTIERRRLSIVPTPDFVKGLGIIAGSLIALSIPLLALGKNASSTPNLALRLVGISLIVLGTVSGTIGAFVKPTSATAPPPESSVAVSSQDTESYIDQIPDLRNAVQGGVMTVDMVRYAASVMGGETELHKIVRKFGSKTVGLITHLKSMGFEVGRNIQRADFSNIVQQFGIDFAMDVVCGHGANSLNVLKHFAKDESGVSKGGALMLIKEFGKDLEGAEGQAVLKDISEKTPKLTGEEISHFIESEGGVSGAAETAGIAAKSFVEETKETAEISLGKFTQSNYREALLKLTGKTVEEMKGIDAHHIFLQKYRGEFAKIGINIDDPRFLSWWEKGDHRRMASEYGKIWEDFFEKTGDISSIEARNIAFERATALADKYHFEIHWR